MHGTGRRRKDKGAEPAAAPAGKRGCGGGGRGAGRKRKAENTPGTDDPNASKKVQATLTLGSLLGFRVPKDAEVIDVEAAAAAADDDLTWHSTRKFIQVIRICHLGRYVTRH